MIFPPISLLSHNKRTPVPSHMRQYNVPPFAITTAPSNWSPPYESGVIGKKKKIDTNLHVYTSVDVLPKLTENVCVLLTTPSLHKVALHAILLSSLCSICTVWLLRGFSCVPKVRRAVAHALRLLSRRWVILMLTFRKIHDVFIFEVGRQHFRFHWISGQAFERFCGPCLKL